MRVLLSLLMSFGVFAASEFQDQYDYQKCQYNTNKLFQVGSEEGKTFPRIFSIDKRTNTLIPNEDHTALTMMDAETGEYRFRKISDEKIRLGLSIRKTKSDLPGTEYRFQVRRDAQERIISVSLIDSEDKSSKTVNFEYSKDKCVASDVFIQNESQVELVADIVTCRSMSERYRRLFNKIRDAKKCMQELGNMHDYLGQTTKALTDRLESHQPIGTDGKSVQYRSEIYDSLKRMNQISSELRQTVTLKLNEGDLEDELSQEFTQLQNKCFENFTDELLYSGREFKEYNDGVFEIKSRRDFVMSEENPTIQSVILE